MLMRIDRRQLTLSVEEVADGDWVAALGVERRLAEHLVDVLLGTNTHVLLTESLHLLANAVLLLCKVSVCSSPGNTLMDTHELLRKRHLLELHLVDSGRGRAQQRSSCDNRVSLHLDDINCEWIG
jgi:hypothetical protein